MNPAPKLHEQVSFLQKDYLLLVLPIHLSIRRTRFPTPLERR